MLQTPRKKVQLPPEPLNLIKRRWTNRLKNLLKNRQLIRRVTLLLFNFTLDHIISCFPPNEAWFIRLCLLAWGVLRVVIEEIDKE